jgi:hypothetical protein
MSLNVKLLNNFIIWQVRVSAVLTNAPYILNLDCDHYVNNSKAVREAMCFMMDPSVGRDVCYVQFPQRFDGIDRSDRYANRNVVFFDVSIVPLMCIASTYLYPTNMSILIMHRLT